MTDGYRSQGTGADGVCDDTCPYATVEHDCSAVMLQDAAQLLDPQE